MGKSPTQQPKICSFSPSKISPLIDLNLWLSKVSFTLHQTVMFKQSSYAILICSCSHFCCIIFQISGFMYSHVLLIWLINVYWMLSLSWPKHWMIEVLPSKISIPFFPSVLFQKHCFYYCLFSSFSHSPFYFKLYKISTDCTPIGILWLVG